MEQTVQALTTKKDFDYFVERCKYWQNKLQLDFIDIRYFHEKRDEGYAASGGGEHKAIIILNKDWSNVERREVSKVELNKSALHEILHLFLDRPEEEIIARLQKIIL